MEHLSVTQAAQILGITRAGVIKAITSRNLPATKQKRYYRIKEEDLEYFRQHRPQRGRVSQYSGQDNEQIITTAITHPRALGLALPCWTLKTLREHLLMGGISISISQLGDLIKRAEIRNAVLTKHRGRPYLG